MFRRMFYTQIEDTPPRGLSTDLPPIKFHHYVQGMILWAKLRFARRNNCFQTDPIGVMFKHAREANNPVLIQRIIQGKHNGNKSSLHLLVENPHGDVTQIPYMIQMGIAVDVTCHNGMTPLHYAAISGVQGVAALLDMQANPNAKDKYGNTPAHFATYFGQLKAVTLLEQRGANLLVINNSHESLFLMAYDQQRFDVAEYLLLKPEILKMEMSRESTQSDGKSVIHFAASMGSIPLLMRCLEAGCDPNQKDNNGNTPCHYAASNGNLAAIQFLYEHGANIFARNLYQKTAFDIAIIKENQAVIDLIEYLQVKIKLEPWLKGFQADEAGNDNVEVKRSSYLPCYDTPGHPTLSEIVCTDMDENPAHESDMDDVIWNRFNAFS